MVVHKTSKKLPLAWLEWLQNEWGKDVVKNLVVSLKSQQGAQDYSLLSDYKSCVAQEWFSPDNMSWKNKFFCTGINTLNSSADQQGIRRSSNKNKKEDPTREKWKESSITVLMLRKRFALETQRRLCGL